MAQCTSTSDTTIVKHYDLPDLWQRMFVHCYASESIDPFEGENNTNWTGVLINKQGKLQPNIQAKKTPYYKQGMEGRTEIPDYNGN